MKILLSAATAFVVLALVPHLGLSANTQTIHPRDEAVPTEILPRDLSNSAALPTTEATIGVPVPVILCRRVPRPASLLQDYSGGPWTLPKDTTAQEIDVGECQGWCLSTYLTGSKSCEAVVSDSVTLQHADDPQRKMRITVIRECACVCDRIQRCPSGWFWNAWLCRCEPKVLPRPCTRFPLYRQWDPFRIDVGMCKGDCHWKGRVATCRALTYETSMLPMPGGPAAARIIGDCGCSDCHVYPKYVMVTVGDYHVQKVNVGTCRGKCGPEEWPQDGTPDPDLYWTTECHVAGTKTLQIADVRIEVVTRCDCRPVRPRCQRVPHHVQHWGPDGTVQIVDIGRCLGRCPGTEHCVPTYQEQLVCHDSASIPPQPKTCNADTPCPTGMQCHDNPRDDCAPGLFNTEISLRDCPMICVPDCTRFRVIVECDCKHPQLTIPGVDDSSDDDCCSTCHGKDCCQKCDKCSQPPSRTGKHKFVALSKKEEKSHPLPEGGKVIAGSKGDAEWLYWHEVNEGLWCILDCHPFFLLDCPLSEDEEKRIAKLADKGATLEARIKIMMEETRKSLSALDAKDGDEDYVCRHYALCVVDVSGRMTTKPKPVSDVETGPKHAWVSFATTGPPAGKYHVDAYNGIVIFIPN